MKIWAWPVAWTDPNPIWSEWRRRVSSFWYFFNLALTKLNEHLQKVCCSLENSVHDARFGYSSSNPSSFSLSSCDVTPTPHPLCIFKNHYPMMKSKIQNPDIISSSMAKIFFHPSAGNVFSSACNCQPYKITLTPHFRKLQISWHFWPTRQTDNEQRTTHRHTDKPIP